MYEMSYDVGFPGGTVGTGTPTSAGDVGGSGSILGGEESLEEGMAAHCGILAGESHGRRRLVGYIVCRVPESWTRQSAHAHTQNVS